jgi:hypothetical protein
MIENPLDSPTMEEPRKSRLSLLDKKKTMINTSKNSSTSRNSMSPHRKSSYNNKKLNSLVVKDASAVTNSRTLRGKFPLKSIVPINGNKGIVDYRHMREL